MSKCYANHPETNQQEIKVAIASIENHVIDNVLKHTIDNTKAAPPALAAAAAI